MRHALSKPSSLQAYDGCLYLVFPRHLVFYRLQNQEMVILRIVHGARDRESLF
ncbi:MAG: type II toxin-antitoxin system RelE/ParE family toxin [Candidatus Angelobacter sp.]